MADPLAPDLEIDGPPSIAYDPDALDEGPGSPDEVEEDDQPAPEAPVVDAEEELEPKSLPVERTLVDANGRSATYTQKTLTYFGKIELYGLLGRAVQVLMESEGGLGIGDVLDVANPRNMIDKLMAQMPGADTSPDRDQQSLGEDEAMKMLAAFARVISAAPEMLLEAYCIILGVPKGHRKWAMDWGLPEIDDETGNDIMHAFIDQNWGVMEDFFARELPRLFRRMAKAREVHRSATDRSRR